MSKVQPPSVFLCYADNDKRRVKHALAELRDDGILGKDDELLEPAKIVVGTSLKGSLRKAMEEVSKVVVFWSDAAATSPAVNYEAGLAEALGKSIVVVVPKGEVATIPGELSGTQVFELSDKWR